ncbi:unnamed protein product, partial [marine sediment metagenome]
ADGSKAGCNNGNVILWEAAIDYANGLNFAGFTDWRVPNINELLSIVDYGSSDPAIYGARFTHTRSDFYHSSTTNVDMTTTIWVVDFDYGGNWLRAKASTSYLRCVRGGL